MNKIIFIACWIGICLGASWAQMLVKTHPCEMFIQGLAFGVEKSINSSSSIQLNAGLNLAQHSSRFDAENVVGGVVEGQYRHYLQGKKALSGPYVGGFGAFRYAQFEQEVYYPTPTYPYIRLEDKSAYSISGGVLLGVQIPIVPDKMFIDVFLGGGIRKGVGNYTEFPNILDLNYNGISPKAGFSFAVIL